MKIYYHAGFGLLILQDFYLILWTIIPDIMMIFIFIFYRYKWLREEHLLIIVHRSLHSLFVLIPIYFLLGNYIMIAWALHIALDYSSHNVNTRTSLLYPLYNRK